MKRQQASHFLLLRKNAQINSNSFKVAGYYWFQRFHFIHCADLFQIAMACVGEFMSNSDCVFSCCAASVAFICRQIKNQIQYIMSKRLDNKILRHFFGHKWQDKIHLILNYKTILSFALQIIQSKKHKVQNFALLYCKETRLKWSSTMFEMTSLGKDYIAS